MHRKDQGKVAESAVITECLRNNVEVFVDFGDNSKIDLIINTKDKKLFRVQVKSSIPVNNTVCLYVTKHARNYNFKYDETEIDYFALVNSETLEIAWISAREALAYDSTLMFRLAPCKNNQRTNIRWFKDYQQFPF